MTTAFVTLANEAFLAEKGSVSCEDQVELLFKIYEHIFFFFYLYIQFTLFKTKSLQSPYI